MTESQDKIIADMIKKLGMAQDIHFSKKAKEIYDRSNAAGFSIHLSDYAKIVLSLEISAQLLGITFDHSNKLKLSSLKKSEYNNNKKIIEKVLNLNKRLDIPGIILKLSITNTAIENTAKNIFDTYKSDFSFKNQIDFDHPQYVTMSVYQSCKKHKLKIPKTNFVGISNLKPAQFNQCEKDWDNWLLTTIVGKPVGKENIKGNSTETLQININESTNPLKRKHDEIEDYDIWAKRVLEKARTELLKDSPMIKSS